MGSPVVSFVAGVCVLTISLAGCSTRSAAKIRLQYDARLAALGFRSPLLRGNIRGHEVWFIIDTGASVHTLASWFVTEAGIPTRGTKAKTKGSTGIESAVRAVAGEEIHVGGHDGIALREGIVADLPPIFAEQRIGGLLSPQLLAPPDMAALLDLHEPSLSFRSPPAATDGTRVCRNPDSSFTNRLYAGTVSAGGLQGMMLVDTGATSTVAASSSAIASALSDRATVAGHTQGVGGTAAATRRAPDVRLKFGGGEATVSLTVGGAAPACGADGLLGMDALRECVLILGESTFSWSCGPRPN